MDIKDRSLTRFRFSHLIAAAACILAVLAAGMLFPSASVLRVAHAEAPPLVIEQTATIDYTDAGPQITYEALITNRGTEPLTGVLITDVLPAGANLLYFSDPDKSGWLSSQRDTESGRMALWRSPKPLGPGQTATLVYAVSVPWTALDATELDKGIPVGSADGWTQTAEEESVVVAVDQTERPTPTPAPTDTPTPRPTATASNTPEPAVTSTAPSTSTPEPAATSVAATPTAEIMATSTPPLTSTPKVVTEPTGAGIPIELIVIVIFAVILVAVAVWFTVRKH